MRIHTCYMWKFLEKNEKSGCEGNLNLTKGWLQLFFFLAAGLSVKLLDLARQPDGLPDWKKKYPWPRDIFEIKPMNLMIKRTTTRNIFMATAHIPNV